MKYTKSLIASQANNLLGGSRVFDIAEDSNAVANWMNDNFDHLLELSLMNYPWRFAQETRSLQKSDTIGNVQDYVYTKDPELIRLIAVYTKKNLILNDYTENINSIECNEPDGIKVLGVYLQKIDNLPAYFVQYFLYFLAQSMAAAFTEQVEKANYFNQLAENELQKACHLENSIYQSSYSACCPNCLNKVNFL